MNLNFDDFKSVCSDIDSLQKETRLIQGRCLYSFLNKISWPLDWIPAICFYIFLISISDHLLILEKFRNSILNFSSESALAQFLMDILGYILGVSDVVMEFAKFVYLNSGSTLIIAIGLLFLGKNLKYFYNNQQ